MSECKQINCPLSHDANFPHETVTMQTLWSKETVQIDKGIAPLIGALWNRKIRTRLSCEHNVPDGFVWLQFPGVNSARRFMTRLIEENLHDKLFVQRVLGASRTYDKWRHAYFLKRTPTTPTRKVSYDLGWWRSKYNLYTRITRSSPTQHRASRVSIRFPHTDFSRVMQAFE